MLALGRHIYIYTHTLINSGPKLFISLGEVRGLGRGH